MIGLCEVLDVIWFNLDHRGMFPLHPKEVFTSKLNARQSAAVLVWRLWTALPQSSRFKKPKALEADIRTNDDRMVSLVGPVFSKS
jgi:hypothetical protein